MKRRKPTNKYQTDHFSQKAKKENFPARSVYKLQEIQRKFRLINKGDKVLDLGCAPGSWSKYAGQIIGSQGRVVGIDQNKVTQALLPNVTVLTADVFELAEKDNKNLAELIGNGYNIVLSDMAPSTTGQKDVDAARSFYLCQAALSIARRVLKPGGCFVCKIFQGEDSDAFKQAVCNSFDRHKLFKPQSCRKESKETYIIGMRKKQEDH